MSCHPPSIRKCLFTYQYYFILKLFSIKHGYYLVLLFESQNNNKLFECGLSKFPRSVLKVVVFFLQVKLFSLFLWYNLSSLWVMNSVGISEGLKDRV